jgi:hypothetical protein
MHKEQGSTKIPSQQPESTGGSNRAVLDLTGEINGKTFLLRPLLRLMLEQVENGFSYNPEQAEAIDALHTLVHSAQAYLADIKKLCEDAQLAPREVRAPEPLSFVDAHGATVIISPGHARNYASIKADQLRVLTNLLSDDAIGELGLDKKDLDTFQLMAFEYANTVNSLIDIVADDVANSVKGGA